MKPEERCAKQIYQAGSWHTYPCSRKGIIEEDGSLWCKQHAPSSVATRRAETNARWDRERDARRRQNRIEAAERGLVRALRSHGLPVGSHEEIQKALAELMSAEEQS